MAKPKFFYDNRLADATVVASTTAAGYSALNVADWRPYTFWKPTALPATLTVNCGSAKAADYALVYSHTLFSSGCSVEVRGSTDNFVTSNVLVSSVTPSSDNPFLLTFGSVSYQYWRINITGAATMPSMAIVAIGAVLDLANYIGEGFDPLTRTLQGQTNRNENGQPLGRTISYALWSQSITIQRVSWTWLRSTFLPIYTKTLRSTPFVFGWEIGQYPDDLKLVTMGDTLQTPHQNGQMATLQFDLTAVV